MSPWQKYLFESHTESKLQAWARRLQMFRFCRAYGGHAADGDSLEVAFPFETTNDLERFFDFLGVPLVHFAVQPPQPEPGLAYRSDVYGQFKSLIPSTQWLQQPGHCMVHEQKVFAWCDPGMISISIGLDYVVTETDVCSAEVVEKVLANAPLRHKDPPRDNEHCICPKYYPDYFA